MAIFGMLNFWGVDSYIPQIGIKLFVVPSLLVLGLFDFLKRKTINQQLPPFLCLKEALGQYGPAKNKRFISEEQTSSEDSYPMLGS